jgi:hypothetical protein
MGWTTSHSWCLLMGGFYFEADKAGASPFIPESPDLILTPEAIEQLLCTKPLLLPEISEEVMLGWSKADRLRKLLALLQVFNLVAQSIGRLIMHLPVSQLEINTIGHVLCVVKRPRYGSYSPGSIASAELYQLN